MAKLNLHAFLAEMNQNQSPADKEFEALHPVKKKDEPNATEAQFKGTTVKKDESKLTHSSNATGMVDDIKKEQPLGESFEDGVARNLQEISKKTLGSYIKKASTSRTWSGMDMVSKDKNSAEYKDASATAKKRREGISKAVDKLTKEDVEQIDELSKRTLHSYAAKAKGSASASRKIAKFAQSRDEDDRAAEFADKAKRRAAGAKKATAKLSEEQLDELSKKTLGRYIEKASKRAVNNTEYAGGDRADRDAAAAKGDHEKADRYQDSADARKKNVSKRLGGITKAARKLAEEYDVDSMSDEDLQIAIDELMQEELIAELSKGTLKAYVSAAKEDGQSGRELQAHHDAKASATKGKTSQAHSDVAAKHGAVADKRSAGIAKAISKLKNK